MQNILKNYTLVIIAVTIILLGNIAFAGEDTNVANSLAYQGLSYYRKGDLKKAINYFSRALLLNPHNKISQKNLIKISSDKNLITEQKINLLLLESLISNTRTIKNKIDYYKNKNFLINKELLNLGYDKKALSQELLDIENAFLNSEKSKYKDNKIQNYEEISPLKTVNLFFGFEKKQLANKLAYIKNQYNKLLEIKKEFVQKKLNLSNITPIDKNRNIYLYASTNDTERKYVAAENKKSTQDIKKMITSQKKDINAFQTELLSVSNNVEQLGDGINAKNKKIKDLSSQLVNFALKLSEKDRLLSDKKKNLNILNKELSELQSRLDLGQKIISDKDNEIMVLQNKLSKMPSIPIPSTSNISKKTGGINLKNKKIVELNNVLELYRKKLNFKQKEVQQKNNSLESLTEKLVKLQEQIEKSRKELFIGNKIIRERDNQIRSLKNTIDILREKKDVGKNNMEKILHNKTEKLHTISHMLQLYKEKLSKANESLRTKNANISELEEQLLIIQTKLFNRDKYFKEANARLSSLKKQILSIQNKLKIFIDEKDIHRINKPSVDKEIERLKSKIKDIHVFLQKNLSETETQDIKATTNN